jgi:hypothetical protein
MKQDKGSKCGVCATPHFERNNYFYGKQFTVRDLLQEQSYFNEKRQLVNRMVLGWGVVCGLDVSWDQEKRKFIVETGMALDCCGHEIIVCERRQVPLEDDEEQSGYAKEKPQREGKFVLCLEYDECQTEPVELPSAGCDDEERTEFNRVRDGYKLRIKEWDDRCHKQPHGDASCLDRYKHEVEKAGLESPDCETKDIHHYLCEKLTEGCPECKDCDCVVLATIYVSRTPGKQQQPPDYSQYRYEKPGVSQQGPGQGEQNEYKQSGQYEQPTGEKPIEVWLDTCTDRRLVYNNSLLYDLIYCHHGDLPHIVDFNWRGPAGADRQLEWDTFVQLVKDGLTVYFDQEMAPPSLNSHTFIVSYLYRETGTQTFVEKRIPVKEIRTGKIGNCYTATFWAKDVWISSELDKPDSELIVDTRHERALKVEITLRGSRIWSTGGKGLDGDYLADKLPTGNGTQGGDFVDWFRVLPPEAKKPPEGKSYEDY